MSLKYIQNWGFLLVVLAYTMLTKWWIYEDLNFRVHICCVGIFMAGGDRQLEEAVLLVKRFYFIPRLLNVTKPGRLSGFIHQRQSTCSTATGGVKYVPTMAFRRLAALSSTPIVSGILCACPGLGTGWDSWSTTTRVRPIDIRRSILALDYKYVDLTSSDILEWGDPSLQP